jgi:DNA-binding response OmpR family regulator
MKRSGTLVLGFTRRGDQATELRAFDLGVDNILTLPFSPEDSSPAPS